MGSPVFVCNPHPYPVEGEDVRKGGKEIAFQKWCGLADEENSLNIINGGTYGGCMKDSEIQISLLRTAVYSAHPVQDVELAPKDRIYEHIDMGERSFSFRIMSNSEFVDSEAEIFNQQPITLSYFPSGSGEKIKTSLKIDNKNILLSALRKEEIGTLIRLFNSSEREQGCKMLYGEDELQMRFTAFEVKTYIKTSDGYRETNMLGE